MKIKKLVKVTAKSDYMDVEVTMTSSKATGYVKRLKKIHDLQMKSLMIKKEFSYRRGFFIKRTFKMILPEGINQKIKVTIEPAGEIID